MPNDFIPNSDADALSWMLGFKTNTALSPATYFLSGADIIAIGGAVELFQQAYNTSTNALTRGPIATQQKDQTRAVAEALCRQYAKLIKPNAGISDTAKEAIGVPPETTTRERRDCPPEAPTLTLVAATPGAHTARYASSLDTESRAKPFGAVGLQLYRAVGPIAATNVEDAEFYRQYSTNPMAIFFESADRGKIATYWGRWVGVRGDVGTFSNPVSMAIAA